MGERSWPFTTLEGPIALEPSVIRFVFGVVLAAVIAGVARLVGALSVSGAAAAIAIGTAAVVAGWSWGALLVAYFVTSVALTRYRAEAKAARTGAIAAKGGPRDARQVFANGLVFAVGGILWLATGWDGWQALGGAALAAAASDTWATEVGVAAGDAPRSIIGWRSVPAGTSGGVSVPGLAAAIAGSAFISLAALALSWPRDVVPAVFAGGIVGSTADSLLGGTVQQRRWCDRCNAPTESAIHTCGSPTRVVSGITWLDNDVVNVLGTVAGGLLGLVLVA